MLHPLLSGDFGDGGGLGVEELRKRREDMGWKWKKKGRKGRRKKMKIKKALERGTQVWREGNLRNGTEDPIFIFQFVPVALECDKSHCSMIQK